MAENKRTFFNLYVSNIQSNISAYATFLVFPKSYETLHLFMVYTNKIYFVVHVLFVLPTLWLLQYTLRKDKPLFALSLLLLIPFYVIMLSSGISFFQGDRLVLPALPLWITLYLLILHTIRATTLQRSHEKQPNTM